MTPAELRLDGNAAAGLLTEVFAVEATILETRCGGCGAVRAVGALVVYLHAPGLVVRCPGCDHAIVRVATRSGIHCVDLGGAVRGAPARASA